MEIKVIMHGSVFPQYEPDYIEVKVEGADKEKDKKKIINALLEAVKELNK